MDEVVHRFAGRCVVVVPRGGVGPILSGRGGVEYPSIERIVLGGARDSATGAPISPWTMFYRHASNPETYSVLFIACLALISVCSVFVLFRHAARPKRTLFANIGCVASIAWRVALWSALGILVCLFCFWPIVSFWGTLAYISVDRFAEYAWITDSPLTRGAVGAGVLLGVVTVCSACAKRIVRGDIRAERMGTRAIAPDGPRCVSCGYDIASLSACPECGMRAGQRPPRTVAAMFRRYRWVFGGAFLILVLCCAPLIVGVARILIARV